MKKTLFLLFGLFGLLLVSCTKEIQVDLDEGDRRLVVDAWFTTEQKVHEIRLTQTADYFSNAPAPLVSGATVQISGGGDVWPFTEVSPGIYHSQPNAHAKHFTDYTLSIYYEGEIYEATDHCDTVPAIEQLALWYNEDTVDGSWYDILVWTTELQGHGDWYCWRVLVNNEYVKDTLSEIYFDNDEYLGDGLYFEAFPLEWIWADLVQSGDTVTLEQHNISEKTYRSFEAVLTETEWKGGLFDSPPANIPTNISNNGYGVFVVSSVENASVIVP
ncbi:MAG: DUF4249 domain-containing protein [Crocinitomicaceae bacterium]|nr:DUF4249 domain-containing protein [Crocinitomicaceae bacterium]